MRSTLFPVVFALSIGCGGGHPSPDTSGGRSGKAGAMQPKWTMIEGVRDCVGTILSNYACTPPGKPAACSDEAWQELTALSGDDALTPCALEPDLLACTATADDHRCFPEDRPTVCTDEKWAKVKDVSLVSPCAAR